LTYYEIRSDCYRSDLGIKDIAAEADHFDNIATTYIVKKSGKIIGGARTIHSKPDAFHRLPLEESGFSLDEAMPRLQLRTKSYCEISRLAILPEYRAPAVIEYLVRFMFAFLEYHDTHYLFTNSPLVQARTYRKITNGLGYNYAILTDLEMPVQTVYSALQRVVLSVMPFNQSMHIGRDTTGNNGFSNLEYLPLINKAA
jgi:Acetyltransferase (GNAT) domain